MLDPIENQKDFLDDKIDEKSMQDIFSKLEQPEGFDATDGISGLFDDVNDSEEFPAGCDGICATCELEHCTGSDTDLDDLLEGFNDGDDFDDIEDLDDECGCGSDEECGCDLESNCCENCHCHQEDKRDYRLTFDE